MKILYITNQICGAGGLERVLSIKASYLAENMGYEVHIVSLNQGDLPFFFQFSERIQHHDILVSGSFFSYIKRYCLGLRNIVNIIKPDVISVCDDGLKGFFLPIILGKPCPMIYERHVSKNIEIKKDKIGITTKLKSKLIFYLMNFLAETYSRFVVLTKGNTQEWQINNIEIIPNPLTFYPEQSSSLTNKKVIAVGKQSYQKGYDRLLQSWQIVHENFKEWNLEIYGKKDEFLQLELLAKKLGIDKNVFFFDADKNIQQKYLESSIYVMSSRFEGFGMVLIEAMACGVPCVSFDCPHGPSDIIVNNDDGFLVDNNDVQLLAQRLMQLIEDESLRKKLGNKAKQNVKRFLPKIIMEQWDDLFKKLAK